jgi:hypothetical protein
MDDDLEKANNVKLLLCAFEQLSGPKSTSIKVAFSVLVMPRILKVFIHGCLSAKLGHIHSCI